MSALGLGAIACGNGGGETDEPLETVGATTTTTDSALPSCREVDQAVVFMVFGGATAGARGETTSWVGDPDAGPTARPGAAALASAYRDIGYQVLYVALLPSETVIGDRPVVDAVTVWLGINGFPVGEGATVWAPPGDGTGDLSVALIEELTRRGASGLELDAGYTGNANLALPLVSGGVPGDKVFTLGSSGGEVAGTDVTSTPLSDDDLAAHRAEVQSLEPICQ